MEIFTSYSGILAFQLEESEQIYIKQSNLCSQCTDTKQSWLQTVLLYIPYTYVWPEFNHKMISDDNPYNEICPKGPDGYQKKQVSASKCQHKNSLPTVVLIPVRGTVGLQGHTQNHNDSQRCCK
jgi:hypothetical protein